MSDIEGQTVIPVVEAAVPKPKRSRKTRMIWVAFPPVGGAGPVICPGLEATSLEQVEKNVRARFEAETSVERFAYVTLKEGRTITLARATKTVVKVS